MENLYLISWGGSLLFMFVAWFRMRKKCVSLFKKIYGGETSVFSPSGSLRATKHVLFFWRSYGECPDPIFRISFCIASVCLWALIAMAAVLFSVSLFVLAVALFRL